MTQLAIRGLAIKGHATRGKEVIKILKMLGGKNDNHCCGGFINRIYFINEYGYIESCDSMHRLDYCQYTLEEFIEKFPYKVGDRVRIPEYESEVCINKMLWNGNEVLYEVVVDDEVERYSAEELNEFNEPNEEEVMKTITIDDFKANTKEWLIDKLHDMVISKAIKTIGDIHEELHKPQYPKTYDECVDMFNCTVETVNLTTIAALRKLIYCRNAYWKIAGEQIGLGKPWEPDWLDTSTQKYCIYYVGDEIKKQPMMEVHHFLAFPTKEIRDMFYENFKELIKSCEEFL